MAESSDTTLEVFAVPSAFTGGLETLLFLFRGSARKKGTAGTILCDGATAFGNTTSDRSCLEDEEGMGCGGEAILIIKKMHNLIGVMPQAPK